MDNKEFFSFRRRFQKTQKQVSQLLGTSLKASCTSCQGKGLKAFIFSSPARVPRERRDSMATRAVLVMAPLALRLVFG